MSWNLFGRNLDLAQVVLDIIYQKKYDPVMEEFRRNGRDVDIEQQGHKLPKLRHNVFHMSNNAPKLRHNVFHMSNNASKPKQECKFCKNNGEDVKFYSNHSLRDSMGNTVCPILLRHRCTVCHLNGHTLSYCPKNGPLPQVAPMNILKATKMANGKWHKSFK